MESSQGGALLVGLFAIGVGATLLGIWAASATSGEARLNPTPELPSRVPAWTINPGFEKALALPMASLPGSAEQSSSPTAVGSDERSTPSSDAPSVTEDATTRGSEERRPVSGSDSQSSDTDRLDAFGRDVGVDAQDFGIEAPSGVAPEQDEIERKERLDMAPTESLPGARPGSPLPNGDNPY